MSDFIEIAVIVTLLLAVSLWWNYYIHSRGSGIGDDFRCIVAAACKNVLSIYSFDKVYSLFAISTGTFCDNSSDRHTRRVHGKVNFCVEPPFVRLIS